MPDKKPKIRGNDPKFSRPQMRNDSRRLDVEGEIWQWKTDGLTVSVYSPEGKRTDVFYDVMTGNDRPHQFLDWWDNPQIEIEPRVIREYIREHLIK